MRWVAIACVLAGGAGCRQVLGLDEAIVLDKHDAPPPDLAADDDAPLDVPSNGHDEDGDGIPDDGDNCPSISNSDQAATDMVGTLCDPRPELGDRIALFLPFAPAGKPPELDNTSATFALDYVDLDDQEIRTEANFVVRRVTIDLEVLSFSLTNAYVELSVGPRSCRLATCASATGCIVASDGAMSTSTPLSQISTNGRMTLTQTGDELVCLAEPTGGSQTTSVLAVNNTASDRASVRANRAHAQVASLTVYVVGP